MSQLVEKLTGRKQALDVNISSNSTIFGSSRNILRTLEAATLLPKSRIGLWPIRSKENPEVAMGIGILLGLLLARWRSIQVYRLMAQVDDEPDNYQWTIDKSQFDIDDWEVEGLDENVAVWGHLEQSANGYMLSIEVENDLSEDKETYKFSYSGTTIKSIVAQLPIASEAIAKLLDAGSPSPIMPLFKVDEWGLTDLENLLKQVFQWEKDFWLWMWGKTWTDDQVINAQNSLIEAGQKLSSELGAWAVCNTLARVLSPTYEPLNEVLLSSTENVAESFSDYPHAMLPLSSGLFRCGENLRTYDLLETTLENHPDNTIGWLTLAELYRQGNEIGLAIETFQRAITRDTVSSDLYMRYADLLVLLDANNIIFNIGTRRSSASGRSYIEELVLTEADEYRPQLLLDEAVEAFEAALELDPLNVEALLQLTLNLIEANDPQQLWDRFKQLADLDEDGESVRTVVEMFYMLDDVEPGLAILREKAAEPGKQPTSQLNLAAAYLNDEQFEAARAELSKINSSIIDPLIKAEVERLTLAADDPEFETRFGEIEDLNSSGTELSVEDVEFLEDVIEKAPTFGQAYIFLATAYQKWEETEEALDVLLDGQQKIPQDADIISALAQILWSQGEENLAFDYLNKGLASNPTHAGLLALTGKYLFDDGQDDAAREFLQRAESLDSRHPLLVEARRYIARKVGDD